MLYLIRLKAKDWAQEFIKKLFVRVTEEGRQKLVLLMATKGIHMGPAGHLK